MTTSTYSRNSYSRGSYTQRGPKQMTANYAGHCHKCDGPIQAGDPILFDGAAAYGRKTSHQTCPAKLIKTEPAPVRTLTVTHAVVSAASAPATTVTPATTAPAVKDGTYTVVFTSQGDAAHGRRTIMVETVKQGHCKGMVKLSAFTGSDNASKSSYTPFAWLVGSDVRVWNSFRNGLMGGKADDLAAAASRVLADPAEAGMAFALASSRCYRCRRTLTVPTSIYAGLGPECAKQN